VTMLNKERLNLLLLIVIKLSITLPFIASFPVDLDEPFSIFHAQKSLPELWGLFNSENNPPLHFILLHFWESLFGIDPYAVRSLSLLFSVITIPVIYSLSRIYLTKVPAYAVTLLFIFSDFHHYHSMEARTYSLFVLVFSITMLLLSKIILEKQHGLRNYVLLGIMNVVMFYTHYVSVFILFTEVVIALVFMKRLDRKGLMTTLLISILLVLPWSSVLLNRTQTMTGGASWVPEAQYSELYGLFNKFLNDRWVLAVLLFCSGISAYFSRKTIGKFIAVNHSRILLLILLIMVPFAMTFILSKTTELRFFYDRYLFFITLPLFILIIGLFDDHEIHSKILFIPFLAAYVAFFNFQPDNNRDGDAIASFVKSQNPDVILIAPEYYDLTFLYHYDREHFIDYTSVQNRTVKGIIPYDPQQRLSDQIASHRKLILIDAGFSFIEPENTLKNDLNELSEKISERQFKGGYNVSVWEQD